MDYPNAWIRGHSPRDLPAEEFHTLALNTHHYLATTSSSHTAWWTPPHSIHVPPSAGPSPSVPSVSSSSTNHPSSDPTPSPEDRAITARLTAAGYLLGVTVREHVIIGRGAYMNFAEDGQL
jgi:DNA repair protein RadC